MLNIEIRERENIAVISPDGAITTADIDRLAEQVNTYINEYDKVPNLVIQTLGIPHWSSFEALERHLKFVRNHHKIVKKIAFVSDSKLLWLAKTLVQHFVGAQIRRFPQEALDDAVSWAQVEDDHPGSIEVIDGLPDDVVGLDFKGLITAQDYSGTLIPLVEAKLETHKKIKLICVLGDYFDGFSAGAMWDDMTFGLGHFTTFSKLALVTDEDWIRHGAKAFGLLMPTDVMVFDTAEFEQAKAWIVED